jgi:hypothetical protein
VPVQCGFCCCGLLCNLKFHIVIPPVSLFLFWITFAPQGLLVFTMNFSIFFNSVKMSLKENYMVIALIFLGSIAIFTILFLSVHEH